VFELAVCRRCRALYVVGVDQDDDSLRQAPPYASRLRYLWLTDHGAQPAAEDEDEVAVEGDENGEQIRDVCLCTGCGRILDASGSGCECRGQLIRVAIVEDTLQGEGLHRCTAGSGHSSASMVFRLLTGSDAPVAVLATALYQELPPSSDTSQATKVGEGRKLLSFADSRQDAAFFASYLERTYSRAIERNLIWDVLKTNGPTRFEDLVTPILKRAEAALVIDPDDGLAHNKTRVRHWLMAELLSVDRRQSLEGVGLAELSVVIPRAAHSGPPALRNLGLTADEALDLIRVLLDTLRVSATVWLPDDIDITDPRFAPRNVSTRVRENGSEKGLLAGFQGEV